MIGGLFLSANLAIACLNLAIAFWLFWHFRQQQSKPKIILSAIAVWSICGIAHWGQANAIVFLGEDYICTKALLIQTSLDCLNAIAAGVLFTLAGKLEFAAVSPQIGKPLAFKTQLHNFRSNSAATETLSHLGQKAFNTLLRDLRQRQQAEAKLQNICKAIESASDAIAIYDETGTSTYHNQAFLNLFEYSVETLNQAGGTSILFADKSITANIQQTIKKGQSWQGEVQVQARSGTTLTIFLRTDAIADSAGQTVGAIAVYTDITNRVQAEQQSAATQASLLERETRQRQLLAEQNLALERSKEEAIAASRAKSEFLAIVSHEIRTPMNAIIGLSSLLLDTPLTLEQQDYVETIRSSGDALLTIINDILDLSKIEAGKLELEEQFFDLRACIEGALDLVAPKALTKSLELAYEVDAQTPNQIVGDVTRLRQILVNLLSNAVKFTETGEVVVTVKARELGESESNQGNPLMSRYAIRFAVQDTGIGIPSDRLNRLFQPFSQIDASIGRQYGGTGLGLAISQRLTEMMGGRIWVESEFGDGSTFYFTIVVAATCSDPIPVEPNLAGKRLLIVDDSPTYRRILTNLAQRWEMLPQAVDSSLEALALLQSSSAFDFAIIDVLSERNKLGLIAEIRKLSGYESLPILLLSSRGEVQPNHSANAILPKPLKPNQLYSVLTSMCRSQVMPPIAIAHPVANEKILAKVKPLRILLAEDNAVNQKVALRMLQRLGYRADIAGNGLEVLSALDRQTYDVVLMDVQMPEMDGLTATQHIRATNPNRYPWIIAMTANAMRGDREMCLEAGMDDYISKPIQIEELSQALSRCQVLEPNLPPEASELTSILPETILQLDSRAVVLDAQTLYALCELVGDDAEAVLVDVINTYLEETPRLLLAIATALQERDANHLQQAAHTLKSSSATIGAMTISHLCKELELLGKAGKTVPTLGWGQHLEAEYEKVKVALQAQCQQFQVL